MRPQDVVAPKWRWRLNRVLYVRPYADPDFAFAMALGLWEGEPVIACRWTGNLDDPDAKGMPISSGHAVWFVEDQENYEALLLNPRISEEDRRYARDFLGLDRAAAA